MNAVTMVMLAFSMIGAADRIFGNRLGLGKEFEKGFMLLGSLTLSMIGMIVISPLIASSLRPFLTWVHSAVGIDPSIVTSVLFANDLGGAALATEVAVDPVLGRLNGMVVTAMMGGTISFTIPYALGAVKERQRDWMLLGLLCGVVTIPVGCFAGGLVMGIGPLALVMNLLPLLLFSALVAAGLMLFPKQSTVVFGWLGTGIRILITVGLALGIIRYLTGIEIVSGLNTMEYAADICMNAAVIMSGAFPMLYILSKLLKSPLNRFGKKLGVNEASAMGFVSCLANSITTFESMEQMDRKGVMLNAAFAVSAAFVFGDHLAFTLAYDAGSLPGVIVGKLISGMCAVAVACILYGKLEKNGKFGE